MATDRPRVRRNSTSADSMKRKKLAKWTMPAMSVSANSMRRVVRNGAAICSILLSSLLWPLSGDKVLVYGNRRECHLVGIELLGHRLLAFAAQLFPVRLVFQ